MFVFGPKGLQPLIEVGPFLIGSFLGVVRVFHFGYLRGVVKEYVMVVGDVGDIGGDGRGMCW